MLGPGEQGETVHEHSSLLTQSFDDVDREPDPRRAVLRAYAFMEQSLAAKQVGRRRSETPLEFLARLRSLHIGKDAIQRLTELFEHAKFSPHAVDPEMKQEAVGALRGLVSQLSGNPDQRTGSNSE